jgi:hypothetical protein
MMQEGPNRPEPQPLQLGSKTTSIVVFDLSRRCENAECDLLPPGQEIIAAEFHTRSELNQPYVWKLP